MKVLEPDENQALFNWKGGTSETRRYGFHLTRFKSYKKVGLQTWMSGTAQTVPASTVIFPKT